ncbi:hypothetical protein ERW51_08570 [Aliivibrio finisterrensis]|uniref:TcfC E-set like domain-containing protein n=1 Tax=Aliivibrio finisterrensis TaxID=511998 RepID=UPI00102051A5|nr:TcfC E-set like domain-containing protein [Aliivibrio finisterrensis]RYU68412.1 hypothetical protein ERW54_08765 [Aliivibrio finisterrensis]RYU72164.1 hypothetical protein ERW51_08570 [Aliivibrio finisterrensis]RYU75680.1 hypothetical protein ERW48_07515 [Aliivibrio finisterrensis]
MLKLNFISILISIAVFTFLPTYSNYSFGADIPEGFEELFEVKESMVIIRNIDGSFTRPIPFLTSFNIIKLDPNNKYAVARVSEYLDKNAVASDYSQQIIEQLIIGIKDNAQCLGKLDECVLYPEEFDIVHNYNDQELYLFVSPEILLLEKGRINQGYHSSKSEHNGIINSFDLYINDYYEQNSIISWNNETILGLPHGYFKSDFNINNSESGSELYEAAYHLDIDAYTVKVGRFEFDPEMNSTDFLNNTARLGQNSITIGTSEKLLVGGQNSDKVLSFYVPTSGSVQVYRDERLIYQNNVSEGKNSISYNELPSGRYEVVLEVSSGGQIINTQTYQVYNSKNDSLVAGGFDFSFTVGLFSGSHYDYYDTDIINVEDDFYGKGLLNYQLTHSLQLGLGGMATEHGSMLSVGGVYTFLDFGLNTEAVYSQFEKASHINANVGVPNLNLSYDLLNNEQGDPIASYLYGYADYSRLSLNSSYNVGRGRSLYAVYSLNRDKMLNPLMGSNEEQYQLVSVGYSTPALFDSRVNVNIDYTDSDNNMSLSLLWSIPLSETVETIAGLTSNSNGVNQFKTAVRKNELIESDSFSTSLEATNTYDRLQDDMYQDLLLTTNGSTSYARMNASAQTSTNGVRGVSAGLSSTQIVTSDGVYVTDKASTAYTIVDVNEADLVDKNIDEKGYFTLKREGENNSKFIIYDNETIVPLNEYNEYEANFDSESVDLYNAGEGEVNVFSHPGTVASIVPKVSRIVSFVSAFNDISERPISEIECHGEGCIDVNEMTGGVYRVTVLEGLDFELVSNQTQCLLPYKFTSTNQMNFGQNYCLPVADSNDIYLVNVDDQQLQALFLGTYENSNTLTNEVLKLELLGYQVIQKEIGNFKAIYIAQTSKEMEKMIVQHKQEIDDLKLLAKRLNKADSITYPLALTKENK